MFVLLAVTHVGNPDVSSTANIWPAVPIGRRSSVFVEEAYIMSPVWNPDIPLVEVTIMLLSKFVRVGKIPEIAGVE